MCVDQKETIMPELVSGSTRLSWRSNKERSQSSSSRCAAVKNSWLASMITVALAGAAVAALSIPLAMAQAPAKSSAAQDSAVKTPWGEPDLQGIWTDETDTPLQRSAKYGAAFARLAGDYQDADKIRIEGSPSFVLNERRQKLYGNVGFHLIEANIQELLLAPRTDEASWC
jgi:hypothetical protein